MDIDDLTLGQVKQLQTVLNGSGRRGSALPVEQKRAVVVVDRGWIFAGDMSTTTDGYIRLDRAVHVFHWEGIGFAKMLTDWASGKVDLRPCDSVEVPADAVIFRVPVSANWGIK